MSKKIVVYLGMGGNRYLAERLLPIITELGAQLHIISEWPPNEKFPEIVYVPWKLHTWREHVKTSWVAIAPQNVELQPCKSNIKVVQYMACEVPVVASPLPAYKEIIVNGKNGYIAENDQQWKDFLNILLYCSPQFRQEIINNALESLQKYSKERVGKKYVQFMCELVGAKVPLAALDSDRPQ